MYRPKHKGGVPSNMLPLRTISTVYHGTNLFAAKVIFHNGILLDAQRELTDFGKGFYVTPNLKQAKEWSQVKAKNPQVNPAILELLRINKEEYLNHPEIRIPAYLTYDIDVNCLLQLNGLVFSMPTDALWVYYEQTWKTFVQRCRSGVKHAYDFVYGPIGGSHNGTYSHVKPSKLKEQLSLNSSKSIQCLSNVRITVLSSNKLHKTNIEDLSHHVRHPIISHPFLKDIRDHIMHIGPCSYQHANDLVLHSWVATEIRKQQSILFHESSAYWAFYILYGDESLWYRNYEMYMMP